MAEEKKDVKDEVREEDRRSFLGPNDDRIYYVVAPTAEDIRGADWQYSKTYTESLVEGITTSAEMTDILMRRGIIGPEFEQRARELSNILNEKIVALEEKVGLEEKRLASIEVAIAREELFQWNQRLNGPMSNTCEQIADDARLEYITSCIVTNKDNKRVWDSFSDYKKEKSQSLAMRARFEVMLYLQGLDSDFLDKTPEAQAMREVEAEIIERAQEALKAAEAIKEEELTKKETAPKKARRKTTSTRKPRATAKK